VKKFDYGLIFCLQRESIANAAQHGNKHRKDKILEVLFLLDTENFFLSGVKVKIDGRELVAELVGDG